MVWRLGGRFLFTPTTTGSNPQDTDPNRKLKGQAAALVVSRKVALWKGVQLHSRKDVSSLCLITSRRHFASCSSNQNQANIDCPLLRFVSNQNHLAFFAFLWSCVQPTPTSLCWRLFGFVSKQAHLACSLLFSRLANPTPHFSVASCRDFVCFRCARMSKGQNPVLSLGGPRSGIPWHTHGESPGLGTLGLGNVEARGPFGPSCDSLPEFMDFIGFLGKTLLVNLFRNRKHLYPRPYATIWSPWQWLPYKHDGKSDWPPQPRLNFDNYFRCVPFSTA